MSCHRKDAIGKEGSIRMDYTQVHSISSSPTESGSSSSATLPAAAYEMRQAANSWSSLNQMRMYDEKATPKNVTAQIGHSVYLHCIVEPIGDKMISWIRLHDFHLLTVGLFTYTSDYRFVIRHGTLQANDWALQIKHVTPKDEGLYECQVNTDPPRSTYYYLHVVVPYAGMVGSPDDMLVRPGSIINLTCVISRSPEPPAFVFWYHNDRMINYDYNSNDNRGEITMHKDAEKSDTVISRLIIRNARLSDSGNYTCTPSNAEPTSIYVRVMQGNGVASDAGSSRLTNFLAGEKRLSNDMQNDEGGSTEYTGNGCCTIYHFHTSTQLLNIITFVFIVFELLIDERSFLLVISTELI
ncbi:Neurotrimin-like protein, partial [Dinothrombium tinctorium]